jgi:hypothetical protein
MSRPRSYTIAAVLLVLYSLVAVLFELPNLARGSAPAEEAPPFALTIVNFTLAILGFVAVYGVWRVQKWGVVLAIAVCGLSFLTSLPAVIFAPDLAFRLGGLVSMVWLVAMIVLLLRPTGRNQRSLREAQSRGGQPTTASVE